MKLRVSSSLIQFKDRAIKTWGIKEWEGMDDPDKDLIFFGLYHERDYGVFEDFTGNKIVFWAGGDIVRLVEDYERKRILKNNPAEHYCENQVEYENLKIAGIEAKIVPSFLDDVEKYKPFFSKGNKKVWMCAHEDREDEYGINLAIRMSEIYSNIEFHIYGIKGKNTKNVFYHGQIPDNQLNEEIKSYHCGFRPNFHDGVSEVMIKSILFGQYPITRIKYDKVMNYTSETELKNCFDNLIKQNKPNLEARKYWINKLNKFKWCTK